MMCCEEEVRSGMPKILIVLPDDVDESLLERIQIMNVIQKGLRVEHE